MHHRSRAPLSHRPQLLTEFGVWIVLNWDTYGDTYGYLRPAGDGSFRTALYDLILVTNMLSQHETAKHCKTTGTLRSFERGSSQVVCQFCAMALKISSHGLTWSWANVVHGGVVNVWTVALSCNVENMKNIQKVCADLSRQRCADTWAQPPDEQY